MKIKKFKEEENNNKILCRTCAAYGSCKLEKKGIAIKCRNFWEHRPTSDFIK
jgi:hypothetical protein